MSGPAALAAAPPDAAPPAYRDGGVLRWLAAYTGSVLGDSVYFLALAWAAAAVAGPAEVGLVLAVGAVPRAVLMLGGGVLSDRFGPRRVVLSSDAVRAVTMLGAAALSVTRPDLWLLIAVALLFGAVDAVFMPAVGALPPLLTGPGQLARVQGMRMLALRLATVAGPTAGGAALAVGGAAGAFTLAGVVFAASLVLLGTLRLRPAPTAADPAKRASPWRDLTAGMRYVRGHRLLLPLLLVAGLAELGFSGPLNIGLVLLADARGWGPSGMGLVVAAFGGGAVGGSLLLTLCPRVPRAGALSGCGLLLGGGAAAALGWVPQLPYAIAAGALIGLAAGTSGALFAALLQTAADPAFVGRVTSVLTLLTVGVVPLSYPVTGALVRQFGTAAVFTGYGMLCVAAAAAVFLLPALRRACVAP